MIPIIKIQETADLTENRDKDNSQDDNEGETHDKKKI